MKKSSLNQALQFVIILLLSCTMMISCDNNEKSSTTQPAKVYVANEERGSVSVIDLQDRLKNNMGRSPAFVSLLIWKHFRGRVSAPTN